MGAAYLVRASVQTPDLADPTKDLQATSNSNPICKKKVLK
jgi:hypothetical protein